jgi:hypothetical protein
VRGLERVGDVHDCSWARIIATFVLQCNKNLVAVPGRRHHAENGF